MPAISSPGYRRVRIDAARAADAILAELNTEKRDFAERDTFGLYPNGTKVTVTEESVRGSGKPLLMHSEKAKRISGE